ncbi:hypothetical protein ACFXAZ_21695 [Streptomyces sp. NPDC059477]|uniref:hypothetical protein n=1 Tax=Streptomyces sp. NPDC059477 TaxID=3346847 RepID=UPI0036B23DE7
MSVLTPDAPAATAPRGRRGGPGRSRLWWPVVALPAAAAVVYTVVARRLTGDLHYVLAALRSGEAAGHSPSDLFVHRPFFYRWFVAGLDALSFGGTALSEALMNAAGVLLAAAAAYALYLALIRRVSGREAALTAGAVGLAMALAPRVDFLQPEWAAVVLSVCGVAAALGCARPWPAALLGALPLALAVMMKFTTVVTACVALLAVYAFDRWRAVRLALVSGAVSLALLGFSLLAAPREWQWTKDMPRINQSALGRTGVDPSELLARTVDFLADRAAPSPVLLLLPGALVLLLARVRGRARRAELLLVCLAAGAGSLAVVAYQGNWFTYHGAQLPVLAAALWGLAVGGSRRSPPWLFGVASLALGALTPLYAQAPKALQRPAVLWAVGVLVLLAAVLDAMRERRRTRAARTDAGPRRAILPAALIALSGVVCLAAGPWPGSPHLVQHGKVQETNAEFLASQRDAARLADELRAAGLPEDAPVLYLAFGETAYQLGNPVRCRYPIATFLQRTRFLPDVAELPSYRENADCVDHDPAPYAVLDRFWFQPGNVDTALRERIFAVYDCPPPSASLPNSKTVLCTRKA